MAKDYIIFDNAPIIRFTTTVPFTCEANFSNVSSWYNAQSRDTRKPRPKIFGTIATECSENSFNLQGISANLSVHGNYTAYYRQKSFKLHLDVAENLFGLNKGAAAKDWLLLADYGDNSKLRNALALYMGQQFFRGPWASSFTPVHIYIDNEYYGLYLLCDKKEASPTRININKPEEGYTGVDIGYIVERDDYLYYDAKDPGFVISYPSEYLPSPLPVVNHETNTSYGVDARYRDEYSISSNIYSDDQISFIKKYMCLIYTIMYEACINNNYYEISSNDISDWQNWTLVPSQLTDPIAVISKVVNINSFVDRYLLEEIAGNPDIAHSSFYLYVDMSANGDRKLGTCSPWDYDRAFGISNGLRDANKQQLWVKNAHYNPWISLLPQASWFIDLLKARYKELLVNGIFDKCSSMLDDYSTTYLNDYAQNYTKYSIKWDGDTWDWVNNGSPARIGTLNSSYYTDINTEAEAKDLLKTWFDRRIIALSIIFNITNAPIIRFEYNETTYPFDSWYTNISQHTSRPEVPGTLSTLECKNEYKLNSVAVEYIRVRGNYTARYRKKGLKIKFDKKQSLFGLNSGKKFKEWVLLAEYNDSSMLRNSLAFTLAKSICPEQWTADFKYVHLYANSDYLGLYLLCEHKEAKEGRVNVYRPEDGYTGVDIGYFFERDDYFNPNHEDIGFYIHANTTSSWTCEYLPKHLSIDWGHPTSIYYGTRGGALAEFVDAYTMHSKIYSQAQLDFIKKYVCLIYTILYNAVDPENTGQQHFYKLNSTDIADWQSWELINSDLTDPAAVVSEVIDLDSFINKYILEELCCDTDLAHSSFYFTLDASETGNKKLTLNCAWDYDLGFGINMGLSDPEAIGLFAANANANPWVSLLPKAQWFKDLVAQRWRELQNNGILAKSIDFLDATSLKYTADYAKNFEKYDIKWGQDSNDANSPIQGGHINPEYYNENILTEADCKNLLKTWFIGRIDVLDLLFKYRFDAYNEIPHTVDTTLRDYTIFNQAPVLTFTFDDPFTATIDTFDTFDSWYIDTWHQHPRANGKVTITNCPEQFSLQNITADIKIRGNFTSGYSKRPFQIRFNKKQNLLGLNKGQKNKKWLLLAEYNDSSMLRNATAFYLAKEICKSQWVPTFTFVQVYFNYDGVSHYQGLYLLCDNREQNPERVNVFEQEDDYMGTDIGYFFERDDYYTTETDPTFFINNTEYSPVGPIRISSQANSWARQNNGIQYNGDGFTIHSKITSQNQIDYLKQRLLKIYEVLYNVVYNQKYYELDVNNNLTESLITSPIIILNKVINLDSFVETYILQEIACNPDLGHSSFYLSLDMSETGDKRLTLTSPWDFDLAFGLATSFMEDPTVFKYYAKDCTLNPWVSLLTNAEWFMDLVKQKWQELWDSGLWYKTFNMLNDYSATYSADFATNFTEWNILWEWQQNATWNLETAPFTLAGVQYYTGTHPRRFVRQKYWAEDAPVVQSGHKDLLAIWLAYRIYSLHLLFNCLGTDFVVPLPWPIPERAGQYICIKKPNGYILKPVYIFGAGNIRTILGNNISNENFEHIIYRLRDQEFTTFLRLDLETGGEYLPEFGGYKNWFPGSTTYGFIGYNSADIYTKQTINGESQFVKTGEAVLHYGQGQAKENSTVEILEALDGIDMNLTLRNKLQLMWHIRTNTGLEGYINANNVSDVFYKVKGS